MNWQCFNIVYDDENEILSLYRIPSKKFVNTESGKYGISYHKDIFGNVVKIDIPEPFILFGMSEEEMKSFLRD